MRKKIFLDLFVIATVPFLVIPVLFFSCEDFPVISFAGLCVFYGLVVLASAVFAFIIGKEEKTAIIAVEEKKEDEEEE